MPVEAALTERLVAVLVAHPDDETASAGGMLGRMRRPVIIEATDGAPGNLGDARAAGFERREDYAAARRRELMRALALIPEAEVRFLDFVDQEAAHHLPDLTRRVADLLRQLRPGTILTHPYEGGHPDHDACAFAAHAACALVPAPPDIYEFTSYHSGPPHDSGAAVFELGRFLPHQDSGTVITLTVEESGRKSEMLQCFATQFHMLHNYPLDEERFRAAPAYDFTQAPQPGKLLYEHFDWNMTGGQFRLLAAEAMRELGLEGVL
jgi:LmbE family N-acetylglucosaminyl deacetylase